MRILFIHPYHIDYPGGAEKWIVEVAKRLRIKGYKIGVLYVNYKPCKACALNSRELKKCGVELYVCSYIKLPRGFPIIDPQCTLRYIRAYDIVYVMAYPPNELLQRILKKYVGTPIIAGFHSPLEPWRIFLHKLYIPLYIDAYRTFDALHVLNRTLYNVFTKHYGVDKNKVYLIPNGIDVLKYYIEANNEKFRVLWTGRLYPEKGADILCKIIIEFNRRYLHLRNKVEFIITGTGPYEKHVHTLAKRFSNVKYLGYIDSNTLRKNYATSHLYLAPSRSEGMPLRVLEATASGLPVVGSRIPGIQDIIIDGITGKLIKIGDVEGFCKAILWYYNLWRNSPEKFHRLRLSIRAHAVDNYDWSNVINKIGKMFMAVTSKN